ncbi:serine hydrolase domain-containing protein [Alloiococcus sp. CFN-8]|uniref:serine hydrolase domain-containing protein n=1 Tax=Alloiococcus sp. CFN-8 TaxID=3416081 RepID=UPI003CEBB6DC
MKDFIENICNQWAESSNFSGVCMLKVKGETVFEKAYGYANRAFKIPNSIDTKFDTASITKLFTAVAILQLIQQNKLNFEDKIVDIIDLSGTEIPADVTIEQLLNHTSGIADDADEEAGEEYSALFIDKPNYAIRECRDFLKNFAYKKPNFKAGTSVRYCNCSYVLLGLAVEKITGMNYRGYVHINIFRKADMKNSGFFSMDGINENTAEGYKSIRNESGKTIGYKKNIYCYPPQGTPDGGAYTTAEDINKFISAIKNHLLLNDKFSNILLTPHCEFIQEEEWYEIPGLYKTNGYAFEFLLLKDTDRPFCIYKDGQNDGVSAKFSYYPEKDITLVLLANQDCNVWTMTKEIQKEIYKRYYQ